jgi:hypothetical protein
MAGRDITMVSTSPGGVKAVKAPAGNRSAELSAAASAVLHVQPTGTSFPPRVLTGPWPVKLLSVRGMNLSDPPSSVETELEPDAEPAVKPEPGPNARE